MATEFAAELSESVPDFVRDALFNLDNWYPTWSKATYGKKTLSIPVYHSLVRKFNGPDERYLSNIRGEEAEQLIFSKIQEVNIGGILIANFNREDIWKKMTDLMKIRMEDLMADSIIDDSSDQFECDFLLLHPQIGIYIIEVKAVEDLRGLGENHPKYLKAAKQTEQLSKRFGFLYKAITNSKKVDVPIQSGICFPNCNLPKKNNHIDKSLLKNSKKFHQFWLKKCFRLKDFFANEHFKLFIGAVVGCRSAEYVNGMQNALGELQSCRAIAQMIGQQHLTRVNSAQKHYLSENKEDVIYLTPEQLAVLECSDRQQIITGAPGTGKTVLLLLKALKAAKKDIPGRIFVLTRHMYRPKLAAFLKANTFPRVILIDEKGQKFTAQDDVFFDEMALAQPQIESLQKRSGSEGMTVAVITGAHEANNTEKICEVANSFSNFTHHRLTAVIRGSTNIIEYWQKGFTSDCTTGHRIECAEVETLKFFTSTQVLYAVREQLEFLLQEEDISRSIAIIVDDDLEEVSKYLLEKTESKYDIKIGSAAEQAKSPEQQLIVIDRSQGVFSYEWPFVIVCSLHCIDQSPSFKLNACSRALGHLTVVERDYLSVQTQIEAKFDPTTTNLTNLIWIREAFNHAMDCLIQTNNEETFNLTDIGYEELMLHRNLTILRHNFICPKLRDLINGCDSFADCLEFIASDPLRLRRFVEKSDCAQSYRNSGTDFKMTLKCKTVVNDNFFHRALQLNSEEAEFRRIRYKSSLLKFAEQWTVEFNRMQDNLISNTEEQDPTASQLPFWASRHSSWAWNAIAKAANFLISSTTIAFQEYNNS